MQTQACSQGLLLLIKQQNVFGSSGHPAIFSFLKTTFCCSPDMMSQEDTDCRRGLWQACLPQEPAWTAGHKRIWDSKHRAGRDLFQPMFSVLRNDHCQAKCLLGLHCFLSSDGFVLPWPPDPTTAVPGAAARFPGGSLT